MEELVTRGLSFKNIERKLKKFKTEIDEALKYLKNVEDFYNSKLEESKGKKVEIKNPRPFQKEFLPVGLDEVRCESCGEHMEKDKIKLHRCPQRMR